MGQRGGCNSREALRDLIPAENGKIAIEAIQKAVAVYFHVRLINLAQFEGESRTSKTPCWGELDSNSRATKLSPIRIKIRSMGL